MKNNKIDGALIAVAAAAIFALLPSTAQADNTNTIATNSDKSTIQTGNKCKAYNNCKAYNSCSKANDSCRTKNSCNAKNTCHTKSTTN